MKTFADSESKVLSFMEEVQVQEDHQREEDEFHNSTKYKLRHLEHCKDHAREHCLHHILKHIYHDALPLSDEYKRACPDDIDHLYDEFIATRCPKGIEFYIKEGIRKNSPFARKVLEAVNELVNNEYHDKEFNIEDVNANDLVFRSTDDVQKKLDIIGQDLSAPEIAQAVHDNVKSTAISEITRAKEEKEKLQNLEAELANDINMNNSAAIESALEERGLGMTRDFTPTLFQGIMINKLNNLQPRFESGEISDKFLYGALDEFRSEVTESAEPVAATAEELAFVEAVEEYTMLSILKAVKLESFNKYEVNDLALEYAQN